MDSKKIQEKDIKKISYKVTDNGKIKCKRCNIVVNNLKEYEQHSLTKKHEEDGKVKTIKKIKEVKIINLVYSSEIIGYSIQFSIDRRPKFRFLNSLEQCVEAFNKNNQYLVFNCKGYKTFGFVFENFSILEELTVELFKNNLYTIVFYMKIPSKKDNE